MQLLFTHRFARMGFRVQKNPLNDIDLTGVYIMKLLIVDDEELTRIGLIESINWSELGITEIFQADDGQHGLSCALKNRPEIILCDVRMPRMDGIKMVESLQELLPDTVVVFMSGYSDKEYLKAAIKLKAINYVEKPLNLQEIRDAVLEGIQNYNQKQKNLRSETWQQLENSSKLAMQLTLPYEKNSAIISQLCDTLSLQEAESAVFTTFLIKIPQSGQIDEESHHNLSMALDVFLAAYHLSSLMVERHQLYIVFHVYGSAEPSTRVLNEISSFLQNQLSKYGNYFICRGERANGISRAYQSYESAVILMQSSFFFDPCTLLCCEILGRKKPSEEITSFFSHDYAVDLSDALAFKDKEKCDQILKEMYCFFYKNAEVLSDQARDIYYKLFTVLQDMRKKMKVADEPSDAKGPATLISYLEQFHSYGELHQALISKVDYYFSQLDNQVEENSTVFLIKEYISKNFQHESLSVKDISEYVYLSASYVCTLFKSETGKTLNQYITEYRMEKAKLLLQDPRYKIADISSKVGYSDGNYFGKSFKKAVGLSPSEYREKMIK